MRQPLYNDSRPILRNPVILGGLAVTAIALITVIVIVLLTGGSGGNGDATALVTKTPTPEQAASDGGLTGKATATINVRSGPSNNFEVLGVLRKGSSVSIVGKSEDASWLQVIYPPQSELHGWVAAGSLDVTGSLAAVAVATPDSIPLATAPTDAPITAEATPHPTATVTPTLTPQPALPDLVISGSLVSGGSLVVTVTNQGSGTLTGAVIDVSIFDVAGTKLLKATSSGVLTLKPGASIDIKTGYAAAGAPPQVLVIVYPNGKIQETDDTNNRLVVTLSTPVTSTPRPTATATPHH